ncbi:MAG: hypothetical protein LBI13_00935 [Streptococcaceae bacterium]|jgi:hypothetical protein|nr:hypothetical protein [Streptococcaceae bacterium]
MSFKKKIAVTAIVLTSLGLAASLPAKVNATTLNPAPYPIIDVWNFGYSGSGWTHYYSQYTVQNAHIGSKAYVSSWAPGGGWVSRNYGAAESDVLSFGTATYGYDYYNF